MRDEGEVVPTRTAAVRFIAFLSVVTTTLYLIHLCSSNARQAAGVTRLGFPNKRSYAAAIGAGSAHTFARTADGVLVSFLPTWCMVELCAWVVSGVAVGGAVGGGSVLGGYEADRSAWAEEGVDCCFGGEWRGVMSNQTNDVVVVVSSFQFHKCRRCTVSSMHVKRLSCSTLTA